MTKPYIVGITGGSASGKTYFLHQLLGAFSEDEVCLISQDNYYRTKEFVPKDHNNIENYDLPEAIDFELYAKHINNLKNGEIVHHKEYVFNNPNVVPRTLTFKPAPIIVVEGIFVFHSQEVSNLLDLKVFIDAREHIKIKRRIIRDNNERGYDLADVLYRWENHVAPTYEKYIQPTKYDADIIINNNSHFEKGLAILTSFLKGKLNN
ncbi:phosphoribulokinase/uridine kinase [Emticicia oligotrophica DSM 17448]|uniref:uridine/cytidine kinase n=1 Tax=Emticicia oligotrophica (strain DSM 17448 / CIP 109782 / MTCC 6937 / GPTSA100-15) TaxID=929562 RepID=A0ABM5N1S8_EMTOG|nr:uridine kinase [Emticicia oligotrophica]AFK03286.1 phosphoribulokinase/uridine kinase [Emticicia oligotrophica DSM 17448]